MPDFKQKSISISSERTFTAPITDAATFDGVITSLLADTTIGLTKKEKTHENYTAKIEYFDAEGEKVSTVSVSAATRAVYNAAKAELLASATAEAIAGTEAEAAELTSKSTWNVRVSCAVGDDTFVVSLNRDGMIVSDYTNAETIAALETWADTIPALC